MSIPLVQNNEKDSINTSIIAIKRNIERINMLLGLVDSGSSDLSGLATKQELEDAVNSLQPVDEVTSGNMQSVSSNAVAKLFSANIDNTKFPITTTNITAQHTGIAYLTLRLQTSNNIYIYEDNVPILADDRGSSDSYNHQFTFLVRKGHNYRYGDTAGDISTINYFSFIPFNID